MWKVYLIELIVILVISLVWTYGIDNMSKKHPEYKGEDFFSENNP
jgi:hypothetical protein